LLYPFARVQYWVYIVLTEGKYAMSFNCDESVRAEAVDSDVADEAQSEEDVSATSSEQPKPVPPRQFTAIVIDDSALMQARLKRTLSEVGFKVVGVADNGQKGADYAERSKPDLIMVDYTMPVMNGKETIQEIRSRGIESKIIVVSGTIVPATVKELIMAGANAILAKPVDLKRLSATLAQLQLVPEEPTE
jgi:CheY-like chemotaxis protein